MIPDYRTKNNNSSVFFLYLNVIHSNKICEIETVDLDIFSAVFEQIIKITYFDVLRKSQKRKQNTY
jgi:hypothetical protein